MKMANYIKILLLLGFIPINKSFAQQFKTINHSVVVSGCLDLHGETKKLPNGYTLEIKNGQIKNGTLVGNQTKLLCSDKVFDHVHFKGTWNVPNISTSMFADLSYENALKDVVSMANPNVQNTIIIEKGVYQVAAWKNADVCLPIPGNTTLLLNGTIKLKPNAYLRCDIICAKGSNIRICGNGTVVGDKHTHLGTEGEWGMGIRFHGAKNSSLTDLTIKDCWGDCIYVGGNSRNVTIENCWLDHGRRQGISVTKADSVIIRNCKISNVKGTRPECAIDLEPNANDTVDHILIEHVETVACEGGIQATIGKRNVEKKKIGQVTIRNCKLSAISKCPLRMKKCELVSIENCTINTSNETPSIYLSDVNQVIIRDNVMNIEKSLVASIKNEVRKLAGKVPYKPIIVVSATMKTVKNNKINEK